MNAEKCVDVLGNIFHFETITGEDGNYELSSNYWDLKFNVRIDKTKIIIENTPGGTEQRIYFEDDETSIARSLMAFIGLVLRDKSHSYTYDGTNGILAWPYNCNFAYIDKLKECMNEGESETYNRVESSRKLIKSGFSLKQRNAGMIMDKLSRCDEIIETCISISPDPRLTRRLEELEEDVADVAAEAEMLSNGDEPIQASRKSIKSGYNGFDEEVADLQIDMTNTGYFEDGWLLLDLVGTNQHSVNNQPDNTEFTINAYGPNGEDLGSKKFDFLELWHNGKSVNSSIESSMQGQERGIQAIMDEYGCTREEAIEIMNGEVTSGCHGKAKKKAKKPVKSSASSWEAGYDACQRGEGYADYPTGLSNSDAEDWMSGWDYANREAKGELTEAELEQVWSEDDEERLRGQFADERGLNLNEDEFPEDEYNEWVHQGAAMYSSVNRNHRNVQALYN